MNARRLTEAQLLEQWLSRMQLGEQRKEPFLWVLVVLILILLAGLLFACSGNCPKTDAVRRTWNRMLMQSFDNSCRSYQVEYGSFPPGNLREVTDALRGNNPRSIVFFEAHERQFNSEGVPVDDWHTPWRGVHVSDEEPIRITSAGPDKIFGTRDDVTLHDPPP